MLVTSHFLEKQALHVTAGDYLTQVYRFLTDPLNPFPE
jgi:hypothetical protein